MCVYNERIEAAQDVKNIFFPDSLLKCKHTYISKLFKCEQTLKLQWPARSRRIGKRKMELIAQI